MNLTTHETSHLHAPRTLECFKHIKRFWDPRHSAWAAKLVPGDFYVTEHNEVLLTVLGSCVSVCIRDPVLKVGGMNHFMLPRPPAHEKDKWHGISGTATRYGSASMEQLIGNLIKLGADRNRLEVKLFGGGRVLAGITDVGKQNIEFAREFVASERLKVIAEDLGGPWPRQIQYFPHTGRVRVRRLERPDRQLAEREVHYLEKLEHRPQAGDLDLF
jgi:chemotaxis protein CheD